MVKAAHKKKPESHQRAQLRARAEALLEKSPRTVSEMPGGDARKLVHELRVHQAELEMQNEELRRVQLELENSRDRFERLYDLAPVGYFTLDAAGVIHEANLTAARLLGLDRRALLRKKFSRFIAPESQDDFYLHWRRVFTSTAGQPACELEMRRPDASAFGGRLECVVISAAGKQPAQCLAALSDVTESRRNQAELRESEQRLALAASGTRMGMFDWDLATGKTLWTKQLARLLGLVPTTAPATTTATTALSLTYTYCDWAKCVHPEDLPRVEAELRRCREKRLPFEAEYRVRWPDKSVHWIAGRGVFRYDAQGKPQRMLGSIMDITARKQAEQELKQLNATLEQRVAARTEELSDAYERHRAITDTALVGILTLNERGDVGTLNPAVAAIFGYSPADMVGRNVSQFMASPVQAQGEDFLAHCTQSGHERFMGVGREVLGRRADGRAIMLELTVSDFIHGGQREFVAMVRDITARKRLEWELLEITERERQRIGHDLHDGLGQQLHGLSYLAALLEKGLEEDASPRAAEVGQLNQYLSEAVELTRSLAHGLQPVQSVPEGLMTALRKLAERTREVYQVDCRFECRAPVLIQRQSAANHLYRIAQEAVNNAMKHGKPTRIRIKLAATAQRVVLGVRDNGVGIRQQTRPGRGMGLHVMQYRADAISGSLVVQKHPQGGTEVVCTVKREALLPSGNETP